MLGKISFLILLPVFLIAPNVSSASEPNIFTRAEWGAEPPRAANNKLPWRYKKRAHKLNVEKNMLLRGDAKYITIHHVARPPSKHPLKKNLSRFQRQMFAYPIINNGIVKMISFGDIPYHYFIDKEGNIAEGRQLKYAAASNTIYSNPIENHITIVLDGNFRYGKKPTPNQEKSLRQMVGFLMKKHNIKAKNIIGHKEVANSSCPGEGVMGIIEEIRNNLIAQ